MRKSSIVPTPALGNMPLTSTSQWGNLLVLSACYNHPILSKFVHQHTLSELFTRTIRTFELIAVPSSSLMIDMMILKGLAEKLGFSSSLDNTSSSFSSNAPAVQRSPEGYSPGNVYSPGTPAHGTSAQGTPAQGMMPPPHSMA
jgi:hypothetical protein